MSHLVAPSLLSADFAFLHRDIEMVNNSSADWFHLDIMDGVFVPNISFGFPVIQQVAKYARKPLDVHLMIVEPERYIETFAKAGAHILTVHYEACRHLHRTLQQIKAAGMKAGVSLNPHTPVAMIEDVAADLDLLLIMSVNPGFGGQRFIERSYQKVRQARVLLNQANSKALIEIDGGVDTKNAASLVDAGVDVLVAGNAVFGAPDPIKAIELLKNK